MTSKQLKISVAAAAVAAAFAAAPAHAFVIVGAGASAVNNALLAALITDDCAAGTIQYYDNSSSAPTKLAAGSVWTLSCTPVSGGRFSSNPLNVSYDTTGGSWKAFTATTPAFYTTAQASQGSLNYVKTIDPALTTCSTSSSNPESNFTAKLTNGVITTVTLNWGCSAVETGTGGNTDTPSFGLTDVEPKLFVNAAVNQPLVDQTWNTGAQYLLAPFTLGGELTANSAGFGSSGLTAGIQAFGVVFGIGASGPLYAALQYDQVNNPAASPLLPSSCLPTGTPATGLTSNTSAGTTAACAPFISKEQYASIMATTGGAALQSAAPLFINPSAFSDLSLEWARRDQGSGTQAGANAYFLNQGCSTSSTETPDAVNLPLNSTQQSGGTLPIIITYSPSTNDVIGRLQGVATTTNGLTNAYPTSGFVIGHLSGEKYSASSPAGTGTWANSYDSYAGGTSGVASGGSSTPWGFLRLEGFLPLNSLVQLGFYSYTTTEYLHCSSTATGDQAELCLDLGGKTSGATSLAVFASYLPTGIYPVQASEPSTATSWSSNGVYYTNGKTCSGLRHH